MFFMVSHVVYPGECSTCTAEKCVFCSYCVGCCLLSLVGFYVDQVYFCLWLVFLSITESQILKSPILLLNCLYFSLLLCQFLPNTFWVSLVMCSYVSVQFSRSVVSDSLRPHESQHLCL